MRLELHCHSDCSDGADRPADVAAQAAERGAELFCLTDHDTCSGYGDTAGVVTGGTVLRGMELSCRAYDRTVHILLYGLVEGPGLDRLQETIDGIQLARRERIRGICARLAELGHPIDPEAILAHVSHGQSAGRPHVARALLEAGVVSSVAEAFTRFLRDGGPADVPVPRLDVREGVELGVEAGARASIAHPHVLGNEALVEDLIGKNRDVGLDGVEALYGPYSEAERRAWLRLADRLGVVATGGSDYHGGSVNPDVTRPVIEVPPERADAIVRWLGL